jgi:Dolichyl-phosphate-mannose-protein mannosyltransferase
LASLLLKTGSTQEKVLGKVASVRLPLGYVGKTWALEKEGTLAQLFRGFAAAILVAAFFYMVVHTFRWPLMQDAQVMHYVNFLADHGFAPYRDIGDMNMPGCYLMERFGMSVFGSGDLGFRLYDYFLMVGMTVAMVAIAWPYDWLAGLFSGVLFAMIHASDGPKGAGQRDEVMAVLVVLGIAFLFHAVRKMIPAWMALGGFFFGMATSVKPTIAPLGLLLLLAIAIVVRRKGVRAWPFIFYGVLGAVVPAILFVGFLVHYHAVEAFIYLNRTLTAYYAELNRLTFVNLLRESLPRPMRLLIPFGVAVVLLNPDRTNWERWALAAGVAFGYLSYFVQGKGFYYHRYPLIAMTLLWFGIELSVAARKSGFTRMLGSVGLAIGIFGLVPLFAGRARTIFYSNVFTETLESDLGKLGVNQLQRNVQCLDMVDGCMNALYHLQIVQQTGMTGDNIIFASNPTLPIVLHYRKVFWDALVANPPDVFVMSDEQFLDDASFDKLNRWPLFAQYLADHYNIYSARSFPITVAYRVYVRKGSFADKRRLK